MHRAIIHCILIVFTLSFLSGCGKMNEIRVTGLKEVSLKGISKNIVQLSVGVEIDNPNNRKITITEIMFKAWLNNRELGTLRVTDPIVIAPCSRNTYPALVELELRSVADALRLLTTPPSDILEKVEVEGYIKGRSFPLRRTVEVTRQPFSNLSKSI